MKLFTKKDGINIFWSIKHSNDVLNTFKSKGFKASKLSTYDFSTLYTKLPHHLIKDKLIDKLDRTFSREKKTTTKKTKQTKTTKKTTTTNKRFIWLVTNNLHFSLLVCTKVISYGHVKKYVNPFSIFWIIFLLIGTKVF